MSARDATKARATEHWPRIATLDLRIDYLRAGDVGRAIRAKATCYRMTRNVAFTRAIAYHDDEADPIASSLGTFMLGTKPAGGVGGTGLGGSSGKKDAP